MRRIGEIAAPLADRFEELRRRNEATKAERTADGIARHGWSTDSICSDCGDTGVIPGILPVRFCDCVAGRAAFFAAAELAVHDGLWRSTGVSKRFRDFRIAGCPDLAAAEKIRTWLRGDPVKTGRNLVLVGTVGVGKTALAIGALWELHCESSGGNRFIDCPEFLGLLRPGPAADETIMATCRTARALVFDDLGATRGTDWEQEVLYRLVNERYVEMRPTIVTTNVALDQLARSIGERTISRLTDDAEIVVMDGPDRRRAS